MTDEEETAYIDGQRAAWRQVAYTAFRELGIDDPLGHAAHLATEHAELRRLLRELWDEYAGGTPWPGDDVALTSILSRLSDYLLEE